MKPHSNGIRRGLGIFARYVHGGINGLLFTARFMPVIVLIEESR